MAEVKVLIEGYAKRIDNGWLASSSVTLVKSNNKNIIADPGCNRPGLLEELAKQGLKPNDIDFVFLTHNHTDHALLAGIFENARVLNESEIYDNDKQTEHHGRIPGTDLEIIQTPGHSYWHSSLLVKTERGRIAVAGDVFWWLDNEEQKIDINRPDIAHVYDMKKLAESRKKLLKLADYIIPGHGKMFRVEER